MTENHTTPMVSEISPLPFYWKWVGSWLFYIISLLPIGLSLITLHFYINTFFPKVTTIRNELKGGNLTENHIPPL